MIPTGAGDAFAAALAVALREQYSLMNAGRFAVAASHISATRYGAQASYADRAAVEEMVARLPAEEGVN